MDGADETAETAGETAGEHRSPRRAWPRGVAWLALLGVALVELAGHAVIRARVVEEEDWARAAEVVRAELRPGDLIVAAPSWADPLVRAQLGDRMTLEDAGRSDLAQHERLWALSIRGHRPPEAPDGPPEHDEQVGPVRVLRWRLSPDAVLYDFTEHVERARVRMVEGGREIPCPYRREGRARGGGLGAGPVTPAERHACDPRRPWLWVGTTVQDDLDLQPRFCIWQHPSGPEPIRASFSDVPLGERLVLYADIYYEHERDRAHGPVHLAVFADGEEIGRMVHRDGDGWQRMEATTRYAGRGARETAEVTVEVTAPNPHFRTLCWAATTRGEAR